MRSCGIFKHLRFNLAQMFFYAPLYQVTTKARNYRYVVCYVHFFLLSSCYSVNYQDYRKICNQLSNYYYYHYQQYDCGEAAVLLSFVFLLVFAQMFVF